MNKEYKLLIILVTILIIFFILIGYVLGYISNNSSCQKNPLIYGLKIIEEVNNGYNFTCECSPIIKYTKEKYELDNFYFDNQGIYDQPFFDEFSIEE